jgi:hypothetical protein
MSAQLDQCLAAETGQVKTPKIQLSGNATYQELTKIFRTA